MKLSGIDRKSYKILSDFNKEYPSKYQKSLELLKDNHLPRVIESISEGVVFSSIEQIAKADSLAILRPKLSQEEKAHAISSAFSYIGLPYDFDFDFESDGALVCSELVFKSYEPQGKYNGINFPQEKILGRVVVTPNNIVKQFDQEFGTPDEQFELVIFLDGNEKSNRSITSGTSTFQKSWSRPKWYIWTQPNVPERSKK